MKRGFTVVLLVLPLLAIGCGQTKQVKVTYESEPPGGVLYRLPVDPNQIPDAERDFWGPCPKSLWYDVHGRAVRNGYLNARGLMVRWPNGQETRSDKLIRITVDGTDRKVTFFQAGSEQEAAAPLAQGDTGQ